MVIKNCTDLNSSTSVSNIGEARLLGKSATAWVIRTALFVMSSSYSVFHNFVTETLDFD